MRPDEFYISAYSSFGSGGWQWSCRVCGHDRYVPNPPEPNVTYGHMTFHSREAAEASALATDHHCDGMVARSTEEKLERIIALLEGRR